jgi:hypothetical protein
MPDTDAETGEGYEPEVSQQRRLLLGELPEDEREGLEERLMSDDDYFDELMAAEDDLIDDAVAGELDDAAHRHLRALPDLDQRLAFARALERVAAAPDTATIHRLPFRWRRWVPWLAMAAVLVMAVGLLQLSEQPAGDIDPGSDVASFVLPSSGLRGDGTELQIAADIEQVELYLELAGGLGADPLHIVLQTREGQELDRWQGATATSYDWGTALRIELPAAQLAPGTYSILLLGSVHGQGQVEQVWEYTFTVVRPDQLNDP